jgi:predicted phosphodiesterase
MKNTIKSRKEFIQSTLTLTSAGVISGMLSCRNDRSVRFGVLTDSHFADRGPAGSRYYKDSGNKIQQAVDLFDKEKVDFIIELGDFKDQDDPPDESRTLKYLSFIEKIYQKFNGPTYHVLGNHDVDSISKQQFLKQIKNTNISAEKSYYSFDGNGFHFVVLDANFNSDGASYDHGDFDWTDPNISPAQLEWLSNDLKKTSLPTITFVHQLLDGEGPHHIKNANAVRNILEQSNKVFAVFQGHKHDGGYSLINKLHYLTLEAVVEGRGLENNRFYIVEINRNLKIKLSGFGKGQSALYS